MAPTPEIAVPIPPQITVAPIGGVADATEDGSALAGSGSGAVGGGDGAGAGGSGNGAGPASPARLIAGSIKDRDYPKDARERGATGTVTVRFRVGADGRVTDCTVARSSGTASLDAATCKLISQRFRYEPARDQAGRAISEERGWQQRWWFDR